MLASLWKLKIEILSHKVSGRGRPDLPAVCPKVGRVVPNAPPSGCPIFRLTFKGKPREPPPTKNPQGHQILGVCLNNFQLRLLPATHHTEEGITRFDRNRNRRSIRGLIVRP
jgi:hypothetical protein